MEFGLLKYMGSKQWMLGNGLGHLLLARARDADRFVDLFSGTAAVSWHVSVNVPVPVVAVDLQTYSAALARAVLARTRSVNDMRLSRLWVDTAMKRCLDHPLWSWAESLDVAHVDPKGVMLAREACANADGLVTRAYGGYYFSPAQGIVLDALRSSLPGRDPDRSVCLAALLWATARCVAAPGHTAQPFQPTETALPFIREAWSRDPLKACREYLPPIASLISKRRGSALVGDAMDYAHTEVRAGDLVFADPPYSAAQYSRFYHVLETVARGHCGPISGGGRYPPAEERPRSVFSLKSQAPSALRCLLADLGSTGCTVIMTFPQDQCSNDITGEDIIGLARTWFQVEVKAVATKHSTLGGNNIYRASRRSGLELILTMTPR